MPSLIEPTAARHRLLERMAEARCRTDELFQIVSPGALYDRPIAERHRIVFYIGHLEAFDWNLLHGQFFGLKAFDPDLDRLFAFGIDPVDGGLPQDQPQDWPSIDQVRRYVSGVRDRIDGCLTEDGFAEGDFAGGAQRALSEQVSGDEAGESLSTLLNVAIEHRLMHAETLAYMFHQMPFERKNPVNLAPMLAARPLASRMIDIPAGLASLGLSRSGPGTFGRHTFGWDNEYEAHTVEVPAFAIENHKVTNRQYLEFMKAGGYENKELWSEQNWEWISSNRVAAPVFWKQTNGQWNYRTMFREIPLPLDWPVYVSHAEASAYARWAGRSLPAEAQWHRAACGTPEGGERQYPWGDEEADLRRGNFDFASWDPAPVGAFPEGASAFGVHELVGNGWEWTSTIFAPFAGFKEFAFYPGYSANFFDGKHYVMKGASARTAASMLRRCFRNWFQAHYQYVYAGFRCVSN